jgi:hypothetical protein
MTAPSADLGLNHKSTFMRKFISMLHKLALQTLYPIARILFRKNTGDE